MNTTVAWLTAQMRKDFASVRWLIVAWFVLDLVGILDGCAGGGLSQAVGGRFLIPIGTGIWVLALLFVGALFMEESVFGRSRNWMARPPGISGAILAKGLLLLLVLCAHFLVESVALGVAGSSSLFAIGVAARASLQMGLAWAAIACLALLSSTWVQLGGALAALLAGMGLSDAWPNGGESPVITVIVGLAVGAMVVAAVRWRRRWLVALVLPGFFATMSTPLVRSLGPAGGLPRGSRGYRGLESHVWGNRLLACDRVVQFAASKGFGARQMSLDALPRSPALPTAFPGAFFTGWSLNHDKWVELDSVVLPHWPKGWVLLLDRTRPAAFNEPAYDSSPFGAGDIKDPQVLRWRDLVGDVPLATKSVTLSRPGHVDESASAVSLGLSYQAIADLFDGPEWALAKMRAVSAYAPVILAELPLGVDGMAGRNDFSLRTWREGRRVLVRLLRRKTLFARPTTLPRPFLRCVSDAPYVVVQHDERAEDKGLSPGGEWGFQGVRLILRDHSEESDWAKVRLQLVVYEYRESAVLDVKKKHLSQSPEAAQ